MQKLTLFIFAILSIAGNLQASQATPKGKVIDKVIWVVGDEAILKSDIDALVQNAELNRETIDENPYCYYPERIAIDKLYLHQAAIDSIEVNENYINVMADRDMDSWIANAGSPEKLEEYLHRTIAQLREEMRERYRTQSLVQQMQAQLVDHIEATPAEIRKFYATLPADSMPTVPEMVEVQILTIQPPIPISEVNRVKEQLREFTDRANKDPNEFSMLARLYSDDESSATRGGELDFAGRGNYVPEFSAVAFNMQDPNKISRIVETQYGFHIIQLVERRGDRVKLRHILMRPKPTADVRKKGIDRLDSIANLIRTEKITFEQAVINFSHDKNTRLNAGLMMQPDPYSGFVTSKYEYQSLPPEVAKVAYTMQVGEVSKAFTMIDELTRNEVVAVIKVKSKTPTHKANVQDDYQMLKSFLEDKKKGDFLNAWISKKQKETYIRIDPDYRDCNFTYDGWIK